MYFPVGSSDAIPSVGAFLSLARALLNGQPATVKYANAYAGFEATAPRVLPYSTAAARDAHYASIVSTGQADGRSVEWISKFTRDADGDWVSAANRRLTATTITTRKTDWKNQIPWVVAGGVVIAAAVYLTRTMKKRAAGGRRTSRIRGLARARRSR